MRLRLLALFLSASTAIVARQPHPVEGIPDSKVKVVIYEDLECSDCAEFRHMLDEKLLPRYAATVTFLHMDFPLAKHPWARKAAIAGRFFLAQSNDLAVEYRRAVMKDQDRIRPDNFNDWLSRFARSHGVDSGKAIAALQDPKLAAAVEDDFQDGVSRGIAHTPTLLVNGHPFIETFPYEDVAKTIDSELAAR